MFASADVDTTGVVQSVAGVKTRNPRFTVYLRKSISHSITLTLYVYIYTESEREIKSRQNIPTPIGLLGSNLYSKQYTKFRVLFYFVYTYLHCFHNKLRDKFILRSWFVLLSDIMI